MFKTFKFKNNSFRTKITLHTELETLKKYFFEYNFHFAEIAKLTINGQILETNLVFIADKLTIIDTYLNKEIVFELDANYLIYIVRLDSLSQNESGVESINQGVSIAFIREFAKKLSLQYKLSINTL